MKLGKRTLVMDKTQFFSLWKRSERQKFPPSILLGSSLLKFKTFHVYLMSDHVSVCHDNRTNTKCNDSHDMYQVNLTDHKGNSSER